MQNTEKPTKPESDYKKKIVGKVNAWKTRGEKWWHHRFPNLIKYILLIQPVVRRSDTGVSAAIFHHAGVAPVDAISPSKTLPLKMYPALFVEFPTNAGVCGYCISLTFFNFPTSHPFPALLMAKSLWKFPCVHRWENRFSVCQRKPWQTAKCLMYLLGEISGWLSQCWTEVSTHVSALAVPRG